MEQRDAIAMIGAGTMGWQISLALALAGHPVRLYDQDDAAIPRALERIGLEVSTLRDDPSFAAGAARVADLIIPAPTLDEALAHAWLVIEAIPEKLELKRALFRELSEQTPETVVLATNSSSFKSRLLADVTRHPQRLLNAHFYGRPWDHSIVELMTCGQTEPAVIERVASLLRSCRIVPLVVRGESTGFIFNRIWHAVKKECLRMVDEGLASPEDIDRIWMTVVGTQIGPFGWMDRAGLDVALDVEQHWADVTGNPEHRPPAFFVEMVERGWLGRKTGQGFYRYPNPPFEDPAWLQAPLKAKANVHRRLRRVLRTGHS